MTLTRRRKSLKTSNFGGGCCQKPAKTVEFSIFFRRGHRPRRQKILPVVPWIIKSFLYPENNNKFWPGKTKKASPFIRKRFQGWEKKRRIVAKNRVSLSLSGGSARDSAFSVATILLLCGLRRYISYLDARPIQPRDLRTLTIVVTLKIPTRKIPA